MARISKPGLDYFPLDVNFFQDRKVRRISNRHHAAGIAALTSLLCLIYKEKGILCRMESRYLVRHFAGSMLRGGGDAGHHRRLPVRRTIRHLYI